MPSYAPNPVKVSQELWMILTLVITPNQDWLCGAQATADGA
jgi:hypothetical protein